jgi:sulfotransferase
MKNQQIFFQSSMPCAGSTLLQNIMGQNPNFYVTPTSGLIDLILGARIGYNENKEAQAGDTGMWKRGFYAFCREGMRAYVSETTDKPYFLDKSRAWGSYYRLLNEIYPNPKIIVMIRDLRSVFASMEKKFRSNPDYDDGLLNNATLQNITTEQRVETWSKTHPIGYSLEKLRQTFLDRTADNFIFIRYEDLCNRPDDIFKSLYDYLELPYFQHNYSNISQITYEDDSIHGIYGDHKIRNELKMFPDDWRQVLGEPISNWIYENYKWYFDTFMYKKEPKPILQSVSQNIGVPDSTLTTTWSNKNDGW